MYTYVCLYLRARARTERNVYHNMKLFMFEKIKWSLAQNNANACVCVCYICQGSVATKSFSSVLVIFLCMTEFLT